MTMDMKKFQYLLDLHGADFKHWNAADAVAARLLLDTDDAARAAFAQAQSLDKVLDAHQVGPLPDLVTARLMDALDRPSPASYINDNDAHGARLFARRFRLGGLALAACAAFVMLFAVLSQNVPPQNTPASGAQLAQADDVELFVIAMADPFIETLRTDALIAPLETAAADRAAVDLFLYELMAEDVASVAAAQ
ncbi:MAG: hypothetical protein KKA05_07900 [Alphaproteobacteria bacterium]|nr:hypothetical protein [Alphaproteobacteria bacterium]